MAKARQTRLLPGTLDLLVLKALEGKRLHALGIAQRITELTDGVYNVPQGSLLPCLKRLAERNRQILLGVRGQSSTGRSVRQYCLGRGGHNHLKALKAEWKKVSRAIDKAVGA